MCGTLSHSCINLFLEVSLEKLCWMKSLICGTIFHSCIKFTTVAWPCCIDVPKLGISMTSRVIKDQAFFEDWNCPRELNYLSLDAAELAFPSWGRSAHILSSEHKITLCKTTPCPPSWKKKRNDSAGSDDTARMIKGGGYVGARTRQPPTCWYNELLCGGKSCILFTFHMSFALALLLTHAQHSRHAG